MKKGKKKKIRIVCKKKTVEQEIQALAKIVGTQNVGITCFTENGKFKCFFSFGPQPG